MSQLFPNFWNCDYRASVRRMDSDAVHLWIEYFDKNRGKQSRTECYRLSMRLPETLNSSLPITGRIMGPLTITENNLDLPIEI